MKDIFGYEGFYCVTEDGKVWSNISNKFLSQRENEKGYFYVNLYKGKKYKSFQVHRLVAKAYLDNRENLPQVNHKDGNKHNNSYLNLEWCDNSFNQKHAYKIGLQKSRRRVSDNDIAEIQKLYKTGKFKMRELADMYGYKSTGRISDLIHHYGGD